MESRVKQAGTRALVIVVALLVAACDSGNVVVSLSGELAVDAGLEQRVALADSVVVLDGLASGGSGGIASYRWRQVEGPEISLDHSGEARATFLSPRVEVDTRLVFALTVADHAGTSVTDEVVVVINAAPVADAGTDRWVLAGDTVELRGQGVDDHDRVLNSRWWQVAGPAVDLRRVGDAVATFKVPAVPADRELRFRLRVTDSDGAVGVDDVQVTIRGPAGVEVTALEGHTVYPGAIASFSVRLQSRPSSEVVIPVQSSDPEQGRVETGELRFTADNWQFHQTVAVQGVRRAVDGHEDYRIVLGSIISSDPLYGDIDPDDVHVRGIFLEIDAPGLDHPPIARRDVRMYPEYRYNGDGVLSFSLRKSPPGARIDLSTGGISWTPQLADQGSEFDFEVQVSDGVRFATAAFRVGVLQVRTVSLERNAADGSLTVVDAGGSLDGMTLAMQDAGTGDVSLAVVSDEDELPPIPAGIVRTSEVFLVRDDIRTPLQLKIPVPSSLPDDQVRRMSLYSLEKPMHFSSPFWGSLVLPRKLIAQGTGQAMQIDLHALAGGGLFFMGYSRETDGSAEANDAGEGRGEPQRMFSPSRGIFPEPPGFGASSALLPGPPSEADSEMVSCVAAASSSSCASSNTMTMTTPLVCTSAEDPDLSLCAFSEDESNVTLADENSVVWQWTASNGDPVTITLAEVVAYLVDARNKSTELDMEYDDEITAVFEDISPDPNFTILGFVTGQENYSILHYLSNLGSLINPSPRFELARILRGVVVHELFHHAQARTSQAVATEDGYDNRSLGGSQGQYRWVDEGTAVWFEDFVHDDANTFLWLRGNLPRILEVGLNANDRSIPVGRTEPDAYDPYRRGIFFKLVSDRCSGFRQGFFREFISFSDRLTDGGASILLDTLNNPDYGCNFGDHLGSTMQMSLAAAFDFFQYSLLFERDLSLLDSNEFGADIFSSVIERQIYRRFYIDPPQAEFSSWPRRDRDFPTGDMVLRNSAATMDPYSTYSFVVPSWRDIEENQVAQLDFDSDERIIVSITSKDPAFSGQNNIGSRRHVWFPVEGGVRTFHYNFGSRIPELFVTVINPDGVNTPNTKVSFRVQTLAEANDRPIITEPVNGSDVFSRVVDVKGQIPQNLRSTTDVVRISTGGVSWLADVDENDRFSSGAVMRIGQNIITVTPLGDEVGGIRSPVGNAASVIVQGVASTGQERNALVPSAAVFILRWNKRADVDLYATDSSGASVWYGNRMQGNGSLDVDDVDGLGPEVITYRDLTGSDLQDESIDIGIHYFEGTEAVDFSLDVILNESRGSDIRRRYYVSREPLTDATGSVNTGVDASGQGSDRFNEVVSINCDNAGICSLGMIDAQRIE